MPTRTAPTPATRLSSEYAIAKPYCRDSKRRKVSAEMLAVLERWLPPDRRLNLAGDREYGCRTLLSRLDARVRFTGALPMDAALHEARVRQTGRGRPRKKGARLPAPGDMAQAKEARWKRVKVPLYGRQVELLILTRTATWFHVTRPRPLRIVITRDPSGQREDRAFFSTMAEDVAQSVLAYYARRWSLEVAFATAKQELGLEEPRNGWWRRKHGQRRPWRQAGPQPNGDRGRLAVERTGPLIFMAHGIVLTWYLSHGKPEQDVARARCSRPWDRQKREPSYADMLAALRRALWAARLSANPGPGTPSAKARSLISLLAGAA